MTFDINTIISLMLASAGLVFFFGTPLQRAVLALISIFVAGLGLEVGVRLSLPLLFGIEASLLIAMGQIRIPRGMMIRSSRQLIFIVWLLTIWIIGYMALEPVAAHSGWARSSLGKPVVQLVKLLLMVPLAIAVSDGLRTRKNLNSFLNAWLLIAVVSAFGCVLQVAAHKLTGNSLGIFRAQSGEFDLAFAKVAGIRILRASGLAGEPKAQGLAMAISLCLMFTTWNRGILNVSTAKHVLSAALIGFAMVLTFSSGTFLMAAILCGLLVISRGKGSRSLKNAAVVVMLLVGSVVVLRPDTALALWESRLQRIVDFATDVRGDGWGMDKERPAMIYLMDNWKYAITGVGIGAGPFHFDHLITLRGFRGKYVDPNSGVLWGLYGFGVIGFVLLGAALMPDLKGIGIASEYRVISTTLLRFVLAYFLVYTPLFWLALVLGFCAAPAIQGRSMSVSVQHVPRKLCYAT